MLRVFETWKELALNLERFEAVLGDATDGSIARVSLQGMWENIVEKACYGAFD